MISYAMNDYNRIATALAYIREHMNEQPDLDTVAAHVYMSPFHFQRMFTDWAGVSPKKFLQYLSIEHAKHVLKKGEASVYDAAYETGLSGTGRLHDLFVTIEGMTPGEYKNGGRNLTIRYGFNQCRFGNYLVASTDKGICNVLFFDADSQVAFQDLRQRWPNATLIQEHDTKRDAIKSFFERDFNEREKIKLHLRSTPFQLKVWEALLRIPNGDLTSYSSIAASIAQPTAQRAVGTAVGSNPVAYIIPCHRVIKNVGGIGDYRWGTPRKMAMIGWEAAHKESA